MNISDGLLQELEKLAKANKLKIKILGYTIFVESRLDEWYIDNYERYVTLYHKNTRNKNYHLQRKFTNALQAVDSIIKHDIYKLGY